jgi:transposase
MGRPSKLTEERQEKVLEALRAGNYLETAAAYAAISYQTLNEWRKRFPEFSEAVEKARADAEARMVAVIMKAAPVSWQAAAWWLERSFPSRYGRRTRINVTAKPVVDVSKLTIDEQRTLLELLRKGAPSEAVLPAGARPALELMPGDVAS